MTLKKKSIIATLMGLIAQIQGRIHIIPLIVGLVFLFYLDQFITSIGFFLIALSRSAPNPHGNEMGFINGLIICTIGALLILFGLIF